MMMMTVSKNPRHQHHQHLHLQHLFRDLLEAKEYVLEVPTSHKKNLVLSTRARKLQKTRANGSVPGLGFISFPYPPPYPYYHIYDRGRQDLLREIGNHVLHRERGKKPPRITATNSNQFHCVIGYKRGGRRRLLKRILFDQSLSIENVNVKQALVLNMFFSIFQAILSLHFFFFFFFSFVGLAPTFLEVSSIPGQLPMVVHHVAHKNIRTPPKKKKLALRKREREREKGSTISPKKSRVILVGAPKRSKIIIQPYKQHKRWVT